MEPSLGHFMSLQSRTSIITPHMRKMMKSLMAGKASDASLVISLSCFRLRAVFACGKLGRKTTACWMLRSGTCAQQIMSHHLPSSFIFLSDSEPATSRGNIPMTLELSPKHHIVTTSVSWSLVLPSFEPSLDRYGTQAAHHSQSQRASCTNSRLIPRNGR